MVPTIVASFRVAPWSSAVKLKIERQSEYEAEGVKGDPRGGHEQSEKHSVNAGPAGVTDVCQS
jgi:hypothetical protein